MKLKSFNFFNSLLIFYLCFLPLKSEDKIDIWGQKDKKKNTEINQKTTEEKKQKLNSSTIQTIEVNQSIEIKDGSLQSNKDEAKVFGIYDPAENDFDLNMWSATKADDVKASLKRLEKITLSKTANQILEKIILSFSYPPQGMSEQEFADLKIKWIIKNKRTDLIESFLKQNEDFEQK